MLTASCAVIVPTLDRADAVRRVVLDVLRQAPLDAEIVVVDQSSPEERARLRRWVEERADPRLSLLERD